MSESAKQHSLCFVITGEAMTEISRARVLEKAWRHGLALLVEGLHGCTYDHAISVLSGAKRWAQNMIAKHFSGPDYNIEISDQGGADRSMWAPHEGD